MTIRFADKADCAAITEIYNHAVLHTAAIWNSTKDDPKIARRQIEHAIALLMITHFI